VPKKSVSSFQYGQPIVTRTIISISDGNALQSLLLKPCIKLNIKWSGKRFKGI
jgi:hypothetical protein